MTERPTNGPTEILRRRHRPIPRRPHRQERIRSRRHRRHVQRHRRHRPIPGHTTHPSHLHLTLGLRPPRRVEPTHTRTRIQNPCRSDRHVTRGRRTKQRVAFQDEGLIVGHARCVRVVEHEVPTVGTLVGLAVRNVALRRIGEDVPIGPGRFRGVEEPQEVARLVPRGRCLSWQCSIVATADPCDDDARCIELCIERRSGDSGRVAERLPLRIRRVVDRVDQHEVENTFVTGDLIERTARVSLLGIVAVAGQVDDGMGGAIRCRAGHEVERSDRDAVRAEDLRGRRSPRRLDGGLIDRHPG